MIPRRESASFPFLRGRCFLAATCLLLAGCGVEGERSPVIGEAYAGPAQLVLHKDIDPKSPAAGTVRHGDKLQVLSQRRRWYHVRTPAGQEGWTDDRQLLDRTQMARLRQLAKETAGLPSQGAATSFDTLNVHTEPNRQSPSFLQVKEGETMQVIARRVAKRVPLPKRQIVDPKPKRQKRVKERKKPRYPEPEPPQAPRPPTNWLQLSKERGIPVEDIADEQVPQDDWTLVRVANGQSGWVLTGRLFLAIPDEVAQYAEGHRITSYFSLGKVRDEDKEKDIWLWTTLGKLGEDHDFDGYRVFIWNVRRHRYETAYIQRRVVGYLPVLAKAGEFSVCLEGENGARTRKMYTMTGNLVHFAGEKPCEAKPDAAAGDLPSSPTMPSITTDQGPRKKSWHDLLKEKWSGLMGQK